MVTHSDILAGRDIDADRKTRPIERHGCPGEPVVVAPELSGDWRWKILQCSECGDHIAVNEVMPDRTYTLSPETAALCRGKF